MCSSGMRICVRMCVGHDYIDMLPRASLKERQRSRLVYMHARTVVGPRRRSGDWSRRDVPDIKRARTRIGSHATAHVLPHTHIFCKAISHSQSRFLPAHTTPIADMNMRESEYAGREPAEGAGEQMYERAREMASDAGERVRENAETMSENAKRMASEAGERVREAGESAKESAQEMGESVRQAGESVAGKAAHMAGSVVNASAHAAGAAYGAGVRVRAHVRRVCGWSYAYSCARVFAYLPFVPLCTCFCGRACRFRSRLV